MSTGKTYMSDEKQFSFQGLSIQQRLPFLICVLLLSIVIALSIASYIGVKRASFHIAAERLSTVTEQLSSIFGVTARAAMISAHGVANEEPVKKYLLYPGTIPDSLAKVSLRKLQTDTQSLYVELLNQNREEVLRVGKQGIKVKVNNDSLLSELQVAPDSSMVGKFYQIGDSIYYAIVATVADSKQTIGYVIRWRLFFNTIQGKEQFSKLIGTHAQICLGNKDGSVWSDMVNPIASPPISVRDTGRYYSYSRPKSEPVLAVIQYIKNTPWAILIEFPQKTILEGARQFVKWILIIGGIITIIGIFIAWIVSRNITNPLKKLTAAATAIAAGDYSASVEVNRNDELGTLARSFNSMSVQIKNAHEGLEQKVKERTIELETVNKELEAFSYSVSHDLRAPLRAISGYSNMLKEDYGEKMNGEAARITDTIVTNAKMMGQLIDDLIAFSKSGSKGIVQETVDMKSLAEACIEELLRHENASKYHFQINDLPVCKGDNNLLKQVWMNLISNAIKYSSQQEKPFINIGGYEDESSTTYFIKDNGVGFDMKYAHKLFGVFQRLHANSIYKGTGIGLALVKRIINKHNGDIRAESEPGKGAAFYFTISK